MVKLRVINGGGQCAARRVARVRLFSAYSLMDNFEGRDCVRLNWINPDRECPVCRFDDLIEDYGKIDKRMRSFFEMYVKELFTGEEIEILREKVRAALGTDLEAVEETVPLSCVFVPVPFRTMQPAKNRGFFTPAGRWDLPFPACAYYDLTKSPLSVEIHPQALEAGALFLERALESLGIEPGKLALKEAVQRVYDGTGLFVAKGKTREERIKEREAFFKSKISPIEN